MHSMHMHTCSAYAYAHAYVSCTCTCTCMYAHAHAKQPISQLANHTKNQPRWGPKFNQIRRKICQKSSKNRSKIDQHRSLGGSGGVLGPSWLQDGTKNQKSSENLIRRTPPDPLLGAILGPKIDQNRAQERSERWSFLWSIWRSILGSICCQLGPILAPKTRPKWAQVGSKIHASWSVDLRAVFWWMLASVLLIFYYNMIWPK